MEALVHQRIGHHQDIVVEDRVRAERDVARRFIDRQPHARLEPLAVLVDEADECNRHSEDALSKPRQAIETLFSGGIEDTQRPQRV